MKRIAAACAMFLAMPAIAADTAATLVQACQSLKRQEDRNVCLAEAVKAVAPKAPQEALKPSAKEAAQARIAKAIDTSEAVQSAATAGVSYMQYMPYVQQFSIALDQFRATAQTPEEKDAASLLGDALQAYSDAGTFWQASIDFYSHGNNRIAYGWALPAGLTGTGDILERYDIPIRNADMWGIQKGAPLSVALPTIWAYAKDKTDAAKDAVANLGIPARADQNPPGNGEKAAATVGAGTSQQTRVAVQHPIQENDHPYTMVVDANFSGGTYSSPNYSSARVSGPVANTSVGVYAYCDGWARVSPKGQTEQWVPLNRLSNPN